MSNQTINQFPTASTIDPVNDILPIYTASATATQGINRNTLLGLSSAPVGLTDTQTLTNKTLTSPTINGATLSGTLSGTYVIGGTPTFPSSVVTLTGSQTLTNKVLTSPTINAPTITNATYSGDAIVGYTTSNNGTVYGISVTGGTIGNAALAANSVNTTQIASGIQLVDKSKNPCKFSVYRNAAWTDGNGADVIVTFDTKTLDTGNNYSTSTGQFVAPVAGFYFFTANLQSSVNAASFAIISLYKNGAVNARGVQIEVGYSNYVGRSVSALIQCAANDYIQVASYGTGGSGGTGSAFCYFHGFLVSAT